MRKGFRHCLRHPGMTVTREFRLLHRNGSWVPLEVVGQNRLDDPDLKAVVINSRDISKRKRTGKILRDKKRTFA